MKLQELKARKCPIRVRPVGRKRVSVIVGFSQNDPLGVGGGLFPDMPTAHFKNGGWLLVRDLLKTYEFAPSEDGKHG